jgi:DNA-binding IclR family transcriptional regulator
MNTEVKSAVRVLELLEFLSRANAPVALKDVVAGLGFPKSSAHALLQTLVLRGYVERDGAERYTLSARWRDSGGWVGEESHLIAVARPVMESLCGLLSETIFLGVRAENGDVKVLAKQVSESEVRYDANLSGLRPAYCTAMGRVLLAYWDENALDTYLARTRFKAVTPHTITDPGRLRAALQQVRREGYVIIEQEFVIGGSAAAAPVFGRDGQVVAVLNVGAVSPRFLAAHRKIIAGVVRAAATISQRLGYRRAA